MWKNWVLKYLHLNKILANLAHLTKILTMSDKKINNNIPVKLDEFHYHEALDRTYIVTNFVESSLAEHPVFTQNDELGKEINKIISDMSNLYQRIGGMIAQNSN